MCIRMIIYCFLYIYIFFFEISIGRERERTKQQRRDIEKEKAHIRTGLPVQPTGLAPMMSLWATAVLSIMDKRSCPYLTSPMLQQ